MSQIQKVTIIRGGGENYGFFPLIGAFFISQVCVCPEHLYVSPSLTLQNSPSPFLPMLTFFRQISYFDPRPPKYRVVIFYCIFKLSEQFIRENVQKPFLKSKSKENLGGGPFLAWILVKRVPKTSKALYWSHLRSVRWPKLYRIRFMAHKSYFLTFPLSMK